MDNDETTSSVRDSPSRPRPVARRRLPARALTRPRWGLRSAAVALRYAWALPTTLVGLLFLPLAVLTGGRAQVVRGVLEVHGGIVAWLLRHATLLKGGASAMTLGHVVLGVDTAALDRTRAHERVHVRQCQRWGPLFIPAYLLASLWAVVRGRHAYRDNPFERQPYEQSGT
jgi:hypothetical protein